MEPFYIFRRIRALADANKIKLSPTELMEILRVLLCPAEQEYDYENDTSLLKLIRRIKRGGGVIHYPLINPVSAGIARPPHTVVFKFWYTPHSREPLK
jgi:hypothetical protein